MATLPSLAVSIGIDCDAESAYEHLSKPENFREWASGMGSSLKQVNGLWFVETPEGQAEVCFSEHNPFGVLDHWVMLPSGTVYIPLRLIPNGDGCELTLTLFRLAVMDDAKFAADAEWVRKDLAKAKRLLEQL